MSDTIDRLLLEALLDSWDRNNRILVNLLYLIPPGDLETKAMESSFTIARMFTHIYYNRLVFGLDDELELARTLPKGEWRSERDPSRIAQMLHESARVVRDTVKSRIETCQEMKRHYDHPILLLQHMIWHEGYHHGQIKLALKLAGRPISDDDATPGTWGVWMNKRTP